MQLGEYDAQLETTLKRIENACITLNLETCKFHQNQLKSVGHFIVKDGNHADSENMNHEYESTYQLIRIMSLYGNGKAIGKL